MLDDNVNETTAAVDLILARNGVTYFPLSAVHEIIEACRPQPAPLMGAYEVSQRNEEKLKESCESGHWQRHLFDAQGNVL